MGRYWIEKQMLQEMSTERGSALMIGGLWLRAAFVGTSAVAGGIVALFSGETMPVTALAILLGGAALAGFSYRRAWTSLAHADATDVRADGQRAKPPLRSLAAIQ